MGTKQATMGIILYPNKFLRRKAQKIKTVSDDVKTLAQKMALCLMERGGAGLAAPQVGFSCRMIVLNLTGQPGDNVCLINPEIIEVSEETVELPEACLSIPGVRAKLIRPRKVKVKATNIEGVEFVSEFDGWGARVIQHEYDHLEGVLFVDHLTGVKKSMVANKLRKLRRRIKKAVRKQREEGLKQHKRTERKIQKVFRDGLAAKKLLEEQAAKEQEEGKDTSPS